jgi:hypothetical protein
MKRMSSRTGKVPAAWSDLGYAALQSGFADNFDDRVGEDLVDYEDEREAVDVVAGCSSAACLSSHSPSS